MAREMKDSGVEWIGQIPESWDIIKFKYLFSIIGGNGFPDTLQGVTEGDYPFCKVSDINGAGDYVNTAVNWITFSIAEDNKFNIIPRCSIIMAKIGAALAKNHRKINTIECCIDNNTQALVQRRDDNIRYLLYLTKCIDMRWFDNNSTVPSINNPKLLNFFVPNVLTDEQQRIANYLDSECTRIDSVIEQTRASIEEYKKLKQAVITQAVTKGIQSTCVMKDCSIDGIGCIPSSWQEMRNSFLFRENVRVPYENSPSLSLSQADGLILTDDMKERSLKTSSFEGWKRVEVGDLVLNRFKAHLGVFFTASMEGMVSFHYGVYSPIREVNSKYYEYLFHSDIYRGIFAYKSNGVTVGLQNLSNQNFYDVKSLYPPIEEQNRIVQYVESIITETDTLIQKKQDLIAELNCYKKSLIYEYVTGKKEVI